MSGAQAPDRMLDPICDMVVAVADARARGRTVEYEGRTYAFCSNGCVKAFNADPVTWAAKADAASVVRTVSGEAVIDDGMRRWYASCRCCLSDAYPAIVAQLDAERDAAATS
ncbi:MAG TPA: YHS domain-containing protein [Candidatus Limnocylindria bacterium]|nr:YHS domain-containing protein [Candidatus Limnocylindria bacterium]